MFHLCSHPAKLHIKNLSDAVEVVTNYPTSMTNPLAPLATANVKYQKVVEISATNAAVLNTWSPINELDPRRISYMIVYSGGAWDSEHSNAIIEDPSDDSLIMSMRMQNAVIKFSRATGQLRWILGPPANWGPAWQPYLLKPVGTPFVWQYAQHAPIITAQGTLMLFDNGNYRASPFDPPVPENIRLGQLRGRGGLWRLIKQKSGRPMIQGSSVA